MKMSSRGDWISKRAACSPPNNSKAHRQLATAYFESTVPRWEEFYTHPGKRAVYATIYRLRLDVALSLVDRLHLPPGSRCLDIGCGPGIAAIALAQRSFVVDAIDLVAAQLDRTSRRAAEAGVGDRIVASVGDIHELKFPDGIFDFVLTIGVLEWLEDLGKPLREISRVLSPVVMQSFPSTIDGHCGISWTHSCIHRSRRQDVIWAISFGDGDCGVDQSLVLEIARIRFVVLIKWWRMPALRKWTARRLALGHFPFWTWNYHSLWGCRCTALSSGWPIEKFAYYARPDWST
jgi:ubiquinone/menaquinone biosynthesis C-methylase UbiE